MKVLLIGASLLALTAPGMANAQTSARPTGAPVASEVAQGRYLVFFDLGRAELTSEARRVVAEAAESYRQTGRARVDVTGYTDTSGSPAREPATFRTAGSGRRGRTRSAGCAREQHYRFRSRPERPARSDRRRGSAAREPAGRDRGHPARAGASGGGSRAGRTTAASAGAGA